MGVREPVENGATDRARLAWSNPNEINGQKSHNCEPTPVVLIGEFPTRKGDPWWKEDHERTNLAKVDHEESPDGVDTEDTTTIWRRHNNPISWCGNSHRTGNKGCQAVKEFETTRRFSCTANRGTARPTGFQSDSETTPSGGHWILRNLVGPERG